MASPRRVTVLFLIVAVSSSSAFTSPEPETTLACVQPSVAAEGGDVFLACGRGTSVLVGRGANGTVRGPLEPLGTLESLALGHHRGPRLAVSGSNVVVTAVGKREGANAVDLWAWHSTDSGHSWSGPVRVTDVPNAAQEGLQAVAVSGARVAVAWLDTRKGAMQLYGSQSSDGGATWAPNAEIYRSPGGAICTCCHPSLLLGPDGTVTAMFRNDVDGNRDMYLKSGAAEAKRLGDTHWPLSACPMDGGGLARGLDGRMVTAWRRDRDVILAYQGEPEIRLGEGKDPALAVSGNAPVVAWQSPTGLVMRAGDAPPMPLDAAGHSPALAALGTGAIVVAWQRGDAVVVRRVAVQSAASANRASRSSARVPIAN